MGNKNILVILGSYICKFWNNDGKGNNNIRYTFFLIVKWKKNEKLKCIKLLLVPLDPMHRLLYTDENYF